MNQKAVILYNQLSQNAGADELDVLDQVKLIHEHLSCLGYQPVELTMGFDIKQVIDNLKDIKPHFVFNLVESIDNKGEFIYFAPAVLNSLQIPYTGFPLDGMFVTTNKVLTKKQLVAAGIPTPAWFDHTSLHLLHPDTTYIVKPLLEDGSLGLDENSVFKGSDIQYINNEIQSRKPGTYFIEEFISGRELNVSVLASANGPEVLPLAEIQFVNYPAEKPKVVGFTAKWDENSFEHKNTVRTFDIVDLHEDTITKIRETCIQCWHLFNARGYARVDFRLDANNNPYVLEINANPCISPSSGFYAATQQAGYDFTAVVQRIVNDSFTQ